MTSSDHDAGAQAPTPAVSQPRRSLPVRSIRWIYRKVRMLLVLFVLLQLVLVFTPATERLYNWLDVTGAPEKSDLIVCLGGDPARLVWAVEAYRHQLAPRVAVSNHPGAAEWMRDRLVQCGLPPDRILVDATSGTTAEHPAGVARLPGIDPAQHRILLVTDADHSRRAVACFRKAGFTHVSVMRAGFPLRSDGPYHKRCRWRVLVLPRLLYEYAALVQYWWRGYI